MSSSKHRSASDPSASSSTNAPVAVRSEVSTAPPKRGVQWWLRRADQVTVAGFVTIGIVVLLWHWVVAGGLRGRLVPLDDAPAQTLQWQVDVNTADWPELSVLPDVGDQLAREIVENRRRWGPFRSPADLRRVRGIGPKTAERITPYLAPFPRAASEGR